MRTLTPSWNGKGEFDTRTVSSRNTKPESVNHCPRRSLRRIERRIEVIVRPVRRKRELGQYEDFAQLLSESADDTSRDCDGGDFNLEVVRLSRSSKTSHRMQFRGSGVAGGSDILAFGRTIEDFGDTNSDEGDCSSGTSASDLSHFDVDKSLPPTPVTIEFEADDVTSLEDGSSQISEPGRPVSQIPAMLLLDEVRPIVLDSSSPNICKLRDTLPFRLTANTNLTRST